MVEWATAACLKLPNESVDEILPGDSLADRSHIYYTKPARTCSPSLKRSYSISHLPCHLTKLFPVLKSISPVIHQQNCHLTFFSELSGILANGRRGVADAAVCLKRHEQKWKWCISRGRKAKKAERLHYAWTLKNKTMQCLASKQTDKW